MLTGTVIKLEPFTLCVRLVTSGNDHVSGAMSRVLSLHPTLLSLELCQTSESQELLAPVLLWPMALGGAE